MFALYRKEMHVESVVREESEPERYREKRHRHFAAHPELDVRLEAPLVVGKVIQLLPSSG